jgi:DNA repair protein RecN (Recombination protein N)
MEAAYRELDRATRALGSADRSLEERSAAEEIIRFQLREIQAVDPKHDEIAELSVERERLRHAGRIQETAALAEEALYSRDAAVSGVLARQSAALASLGHLDPRLADAARRLDSARVELEDVARDLSRVAQGADVDPDRLATLEERLALLTRLARKHGGDLDGVLAARARLAEELSGLVDHEARIGGLRRAFEVALEGAGRVARSLSQRRRASARTLGDRIGAELADLGMGEARVEVEVTRANGAVDDERTVDGARLGPTGIDRAEILLAPNPGEPARPLRRIASGGELSRAMLAVKTVLTGLGPTGTYVFDEVDAGVGGAAAEVVGRKLLGISRRHQVVCVTHLPQVASLADTHFVVEKRRAAGRTVSEVRRLGERERRAEIARMLGGLRVTRKTRAAADEMIRLGRRASP